jgi:O-antigen/teichoic acid export membrane protein
VIAAGLVALAEAVPGTSPAVASIVRWHDFYLLAGTASVTLVGLLFVSLSFHLDVLLDDERSHLLGHARETLLSFVYVLVVSLLFQVPEEGPKVIGVGVAAASLLPLFLVVRGLLRDRGRKDPTRVSRYVIRRRLLLAGALALMLVLGVRSVQLRSFEEPYAMVGAICMVLGNAVGASWDLMVQVGRLKRAQLETESKT